MTPAKLSCSSGQLTQLVGKATRTVSVFVISLVLLMSISFGVQAAERDEIIFFMPDALGSAVTAVGEAGQKCWSEHYTPYGSKTLDEDVVPEARGCGIAGAERGFTGHTEDVTTDLTYMKHRFYDPSIGRFLSVDPLDADLRNPVTFNRYAYANNNPHRFVDPDGRQSIEAEGLDEAAQIERDIENSRGGYTEPFALAGEALNDVAVLLLDGYSIAAGGGLFGGAKAGKSFWSSVKNFVGRWSAPEGTGATFANGARLSDHFRRHGGDFGATDALDYQRRADGFLTGRRATETLERTRPSGDVVRFNSKTDEFGVISASGTVRTYYKPNTSVHGYPTNMDYFNAQ